MALNVGLRVKPLKACARAFRAGVLTTAVVFGVSACSLLNSGTPAAHEDDRTADVIYAAAAEKYEAGDYAGAAKIFADVERLHPASTYAKRALLDGADAYYNSGDFERAILGARRYLEFHPSDAQADRAQNIIADSHYEQITDVSRDQERTRLALQALRELVARYPNSDYAADAQIKLELALDHLAGKEMTVGRYYLRSRDYIAAINRFRIVIEQFQQTTHTAEALHRLVEAYLALGVVDEAQAAAAVLGHNFPGSDWYADSYALLTGRGVAPSEGGGSWVSRAFGSIL